MYLLIWLDFAVWFDSRNIVQKTYLEIAFLKEFEPFSTNSYVFFFQVTWLAFFNVRPEKFAFCSGALLEFLHVDDSTGRPLSEKDEKWSC